MFAASMPDLNTLRVIPTDQWQTWFNGLDASNLPVLIKDLGLTSASFEGNTLQATVQSLVEAMKQNSAYLEAITVKPGWTFNLLITQLSLVNSWNGLMLLPILSAASQVLMTKLTGGAQQPAGGDQSPAAGTGKFMMWFFPIFSLIICFQYSAAFALYWVAGNLVMMTQTLIINKVLDSKEKAAVVAGEGTVK